MAACLEARLPAGITCCTAPQGLQPLPRIPSSRGCSLPQERQTLEEAEGLLKKLGFKGSLFATPQQPPQQEGQQQQQAPPEGQ